jgi:hypothetical protein
MKRTIKKKYQNRTISNGNIKAFNTIDINESNIDFYIKKGFDFIFVPIKKD